MPLGPVSPKQIPPIFENERRSVKKWIIHRAACKAVWADSLMELSYFHRSSDHQVHKANADGHSFCGCYDLIGKTFIERVALAKKEQEIIS